MAKLFGKKTCRAQAGTSTNETQLLRFEAYTCKWSGDTDEDEDVREREGEVQAEEGEGGVIVQCVVEPPLQAAWLRGAAALVSLALALARARGGSR